MSCSTVADMFNVINDFGEIRFPFRFKILEQEEHSKEYHQVHITYPERYKSELTLHCQICAAGTWALISDLVGHAPAEFEIQFPFSLEQMPKDSKTLLPCNLRFDQKHFGFKVPTKLLAVPLPGRDEVSHELFISLCQQIRQQINNVQAPSSQDKKQVTHSIKRLLNAYDSQFPAATQVAQILGMSGRTLRQKLKGEGANYRTLLNQHKISRAKKLLTSTNQSHDQIAELLGYQDTANFSRAFKRETGQPPSEFRHSNKFSL